MSSKPPDNLPKGRITGSREIFLNHVQQVAVQQVAAANQQKSDTIAKANQDAWTRIKEAHRTATQVLCQNLVGLYAFTNQGLIRVGKDGQTSNSVPLDQGDLGVSFRPDNSEATGNAGSAAINIEDERVYWSELHSDDFLGGSHPYHLQLMSANLDGTQRTPLAHPVGVDWAWNTSAVALDQEHRILLWGSQQGRMIRVDLTSGQAATFANVVANSDHTLSLAVDTVHQTVYWATDQKIGRLSYAPGSPHGIVFDALSGLPPLSQPQPSDFNFSGWPPIKMALDGKNNRLYCNNGQQIWRAGLDGSGPERLYVGNRPCSGLTIDLGTQMLYWLDGADVMRINVDPALDDSQVLTSVEKVFTFQRTNFEVFEVKVITSDALAIQALIAAHSHRQQAQADSVKAIQAAHDSAATTRQRAQQALADAHTAAVSRITKARTDAVTARETAQAAAQLIRKQAAGVITSAKTAAATKKRDADDQAASYIKKQQQQADGIRSKAQADLRDARQRLQKA